MKTKNKKNMNGIKHKKTLVTYVYFETTLSKKNFEFFIKNGVVRTDNVHYNIVIKGNKSSVIIPAYDNVSIYMIKNTGYDFAGYSHSVHAVKKESFDYFIFLNDTVRGPFVPRYLSKAKWYTYFVRLLSDKIKLVGSTKNKKMYNDVPEHIQSMAFATDKIGLQLSIGNKIFDKHLNIKTLEEKGKWNFILEFEIGLSRVILNNGYSITSLLQSDNSSTLSHGDIHHTNEYFGSTVNPVEIMFIKTNRIDDKIVQNYTAWSS